MKGLVIWAWSDCRSAMGLYRALRQQAGVPCEIALWHYRDAGCGPDMREKVGFRNDEFVNEKVLPVGENLIRGLQVLDTHRGWNHLFCVYQASPVFRKLLLEARKRDEHVAVMSEAPCEMNFGLRKIIHMSYLRLVLPLKVRRVIKASDFFVNYSGNDQQTAKMIGWPENKIVPFGYFPPRIDGTKSVKRTGNRPFTILSTGILSRYRGADVLVEALRLLKEHGLDYYATITQDGELKKILVEKTRKFKLPISFPGFMPMEELKRAYETCSVYVGAGRSEPWGMRLNDALNCGAPLVVSRGMGGVSLVDEYKCGDTFLAGDSVGLADCLTRLANDKEFYLERAHCAASAGTRIAPENKAGELISTIRERFHGWFD